MMRCEWCFGSDGSEFVLRSQLRAPDRPESVVLCPLCRHLLVGITSAADDELTPNQIAVVLLSEIERRRRHARDARPPQEGDDRRRADRRTGDRRASAP